MWFISKTEGGQFSFKRRQDFFSVWWVTLVFAWMGAPWSSKISIILTWPFLAAQCRGVSSSCREKLVSDASNYSSEGNSKKDVCTLVLASIWAPLSSRSRTMITFPRLDAMCRGVIPFWRDKHVHLDRYAQRRTDSSDTDEISDISHSLPLGWSWHWLLYWAAVELHLSFHSVQQCGGVWIQSAGTH